MNGKNGHLNAPGEQWQLSTYVQLPDRAQVGMVRTANNESNV